MNIDEALVRAEQALAEGRSLKGTGFWKAVDAVRRDPALAERYADRIGTIDRRAFENGVKFRLSASIGVAALSFLTAIGIVAIILTSRAGGQISSMSDIAAKSNRIILWVRPDGLDVYSWSGFVPIAFLVGFVALLLGTHSLTHWIVGRLVGIRFVYVFLGGPPPPRPGFKTDYATYLRTSPRKRALMHASGAIVTKIVPFALLPVSLSFYREWPWLTWILLVVGVVQVVTDVFLSTKVSDWKKVLRELRAARG